MCTHVCLIRGLYTHFSGTYVKDVPILERYPHSRGCYGCCVTAWILLAGAGIYIHVLYFYPDGLNLKSLTRTTVLDLVLNGDQKRPLSADDTPENSAEVKTDATPASNSTNEPPDNDVQVPAGNSNTPSSPPPHITKSTPSPSSSSVPTTQPVIPPRPYRPPRPFPPPSSSPHPSSSSQPQHRNRTHKTTHGDPRSVLQPRDRLICALLSVSAGYIYTPLASVAVVMSQTFTRNTHLQCVLCLVYASPTRPAVHVHVN